jgi:SSS family solute:Na+ symporter
MSSASSDAIAGVSILLRDIYNLIFGKLPDKEQSVKLSRIGLLITTLIALSFTLFSTGVISYIKDMISIVFSGMFASAILGKFWKRATWQGGVATIVGGSSVAISFMFNESWMTYWGNATIPAVSCALIIGIIVSLMTTERSISDLEALEILEKERRQMEMHDEVEAA